MTRKLENWTIPRDIHRANYGPNHRQKLKSIIEELYQISYIIELEC